jgi:hypothetical protein
MCYFDPHSPIHPTTDLPTKPHLHGYNYLHGCHAIDPKRSTTMRKE